MDITKLLPDGWERESTASLEEGQIQILPGTGPWEDFDGFLSAFLNGVFKEHPVHFEIQEFFMLDVTDRNGKKDIKSMTLEELTKELAAWVKSRSVQSRSMTGSM